MNKKNIFNKFESNYNISKLCLSVTAILLVFFVIVHLTVVLSFSLGWKVSPVIAPAALILSLVEIELQYFGEPFGDRLSNAGIKFHPVKQLKCSNPLELMSVAHGYPGAVRVCINKKNNND